MCKPAELRAATGALRRVVWGDHGDDPCLVADAVVEIIESDDPAAVLCAMTSLLGVALDSGLAMDLPASPAIDTGEYVPSQLPVSRDGAVRGLVVFDYGSSPVGGVSAIATAQPVSIDCSVTDALGAVRGDRGDCLSRVRGAAITGPGAEMFDPRALHEHFGTHVSRIDVWAVPCIELADYAGSRLLAEGFDLDVDELAAIERVRAAIAAERH